MADKSVNELALQVGRPVEKLLAQLTEAGLPAREATALVTDNEQEKLVAHLRQSHGQAAQDNSQITLKRKTLGTAKVASSTGKAKTISVEVRKKHTFVKPDASALVAERARLETEAAARIQASIKASAQEKALDNMSDEAKAVEVARIEADAKHQATLNAMRQQTESKASEKKEVVVKKRSIKIDETPEQKKTREAEAARLKTTEEVARRAAAEAAQQRTLEQMRQMATKYADGTTPDRKIDDTAPLAAGLVGRAYEESFDKENRDIKRGAATTAAGAGKGKGRNRSGRQEEQSFRQPPRGLKTSQSNKHGFEKPVEKQVYDVQITENIVVADLAQKMAVKVREVIKTLMKMGEIVTQDQSIDQSTASLVVEELGHNPVLVSDTAVEDKLLASVADRGNVKLRPPVVTIMGHVDHGKTSLLDYIRRTKVASGEAGGITQHIGAYHVETDRGVITFLDTPGHAAFTQMRARGAKATDIVILVVAADDGVMPQTAEAIEHARAAGTPIIVALNKVDKEGSDIDRVLNELSVKGVTTEAWGGDVPIAKVSAKTGQGIDELLDLISIQAELMELTASEEGAAQGIVIEARIDKGRGAVASILVQKGTLKVGDLLLAGAFYGRVRAMTDENGKAVKTAGPSIPVEILGLPDAPNAGDEILVVSDEKKAREVAEFRASRERQTKIDRQSAMRLENIMAGMGKKDVPTVNIVLKADVRGSLEALTHALNDLSIDDVRVQIVGSGVGAITESDITLAESTGAAMLGFNVRADNAARLKSQEDGIDLRYYSIIYEMIDDVKLAMSGKLAPEHRENILGVAQVREVFRSSKFGAAAGCMVMEGVIHRNRPIRVLRDGVVVFQGELESLRRYKDDVNEVRAGIECGLGVKGYKDIQELDQIEVYEVHEIKRSL
jgi:translation initiation factor IF-2